MLPLAVMLDWAVSLGPAGRGEAEDGEDQWVAGKSKRSQPSQDPRWLLVPSPCLLVSFVFVRCCCKTLLRSVNQGIIIHDADPIR